MIPHVCGVITISLRNPPRRPDIQPLGCYGHYGQVAVKVEVMSSCSNHFVQNVVSHVIILTNNKSRKETGSKVKNLLSSSCFMLPHSSATNDKTTLPLFEITISQKKSLLTRPNVEISPYR